MTVQPTAWRATGLYWRNQTPGLGLANPVGTERTLQIPPGTDIGYQIGDRRLCIGVWLVQQQRRQPCPFIRSIPTRATRVQCEACSAIDPGQILARNTTVDDGRTYALYLAWFGTGLTKVGLTAVERGTDRLTEQGALAFTWLGQGPLPAVRAAEQAISASGLATERRRRRTRLISWWQLSDKVHRQQQLSAAYRQIIETVSWPSGLDRKPFTAVDQVELFGLSNLPSSCREITGLSAGSVLRGTVLCAAGRDLLLDTTDGPLLTDARLLAGWPLCLTTAASSNLELRDCDYARSDDAAFQAPLF